MTTMTEPAYGTFAYAGRIAEAWFGRMESTLRQSRTDEQRQLENEILDCALADAGVTPLDSELPQLLAGYSMKV